MRPLSKFCDAADWFQPEVDEIIRVELREPARLHRKQWEFAMIYLALRRLGMVRPDMTGLSLGGGTERLLYSLATHVKHMTVTDLYDANTTWDCARTHDPDEFVRRQRPFDVDDSKYRAMRMDMRSLEFPDRSFDFCYSSCAIEHIGDDADFVRHFNEVARVLKDDAVYVLTTEVSYLNETIKDPNNYVFSPDYLSDLVARSDLEAIVECDARITHNRANIPMPWDVIQVATDTMNDPTKRLMDSVPHITLLRGHSPFGSGLLILRKKNPSRKETRLRFNGLDDLRAFMQTSMEEYHNVVMHSKEGYRSLFALAEQKSPLYRKLMTRFRQIAQLREVSQLNADMRELVGQLAATERDEASHSTPQLDVTVPQNERVNNE